ncbi:MAG: hypothetical protein MHM6MM_006998 [Cercozoa sp. M6MM]
MKLFALAITCLALLGGCLASPPDDTTDASSTASADASGSTPIPPATHSRDSSAARTEQEDPEAVRLRLFHQARKTEALQISMNAVGSSIHLSVTPPDDPKLARMVDWLPVYLKRLVACNIRFNSERAVNPAESNALVDEVVARAIQEARVPSEFHAEAKYVATIYGQQLCEDLRRRSCDVNASFEPNSIDSFLGFLWGSGPGE